MVRRVQYFLVTSCLLRIECVQQSQKASEITGYVQMSYSEGLKLLQAISNILHEHMKAQTL